MYERAEDLLHLGLLLQGSRTGLSLEEIRKQFGTSRRTAERMRDALLRLLPQLEEIDTGERVKRWRLPPGTLNRLSNVGATELQELNLAAQDLRSRGLGQRADILEGISAKLRATMQPNALARVESDLEALMEAEGHAMRAGPKPQISAGLLVTVRESILACRVLRLAYRKRITRQRITADLEPYGVLFGQRHYLVGCRFGETGGAPKLFSLSNILSAELGEETFARPPDFDLRTFAARAFGVFQEPPLEVVWHFPPPLAEDAAEHHFHPNQRKQVLADGTVEVSFTAGGQLEMAWHLFTWGPKVEIVKPASLRRRYRALLEAALAPLSGD